MATLTSQLQSGSYKDLLQVSNSNAGIDSTLRTVSDGEGTDSILKLSTTNARFGDINFTGTTISSVAGVDLNITPQAGQQLVLDGTIIIDAGVVTGATSITSTAFVGTLSTAAQTNITSLGTLTTLTVDDITINANAISSGGASSLTITPTTGQKLILDGHWGFDGVAFTAETDNNTTFTAYAGKNITIESVTFDNNVVTATTFSGALSGNASTATLLETARTIGGVSFNGSANITVASATGGFAVSGGELDLTGTGVWIDLNPSGTGSKNIIDIVPSVAIGSSAVWKGLNIDGSALDPSATAVEIYGLYCDFSGVSLTNDPILEAIKIVMPATYSGETDHCAFDATGNSNRRVEIIGNFNDALHIDGEIHSNYTIPSTTLAHFTVHDFVVDASAQVSTSETHITDYALADGLANGSVAAIGIHPNIDVIHQHSGTFTAFGANFAGRYVGSTYTDNIDDVVTFVSVDDEIWIGHTAKFDEVEFSMTTPATKDIKPEFYYYKTTTGWTEFEPADDTNGFTQSGTIRFASGDLTTWDSTGAGEADNGYWIKIKRKRVSTPGTVQIDTSKYLIAVTYSWDKSGNIIVNQGTFTRLDVDNIRIDGNTISSTAGTDLLLTPLAGQDIILDSHWEFDGASLTALTDNDTIITAYTGKNITIEGVTFDNNVVTATTIAGTLSTAAQTNITSLGTLTSLAVGNVVTNSNYVMEGYSTGRNVTRIIQFIIVKGTGTDITVATSGWNLPSITDGSNIAKSETVGSFTLSSDGQRLLMNLSETILYSSNGVIGVHDLNNSSTSDTYYINTYVDGGDINIQFRNHGTQTPSDMTGIFQASDQCQFKIEIITSS